MLLSLAQWLQTQSPEFGFMRVFQYITFRAVMAAMTSLLIGLAFGPMVIRRLTALKIGQPIRSYGIEAHHAKSGTPTMGGVLILLGIGISTLLWFDWSNRFVWIVMVVTIGFGAIGWADDWRKVVHKNLHLAAAAPPAHWLWPGRPPHRHDGARRPCRSRRRLQAPRNPQVPRLLQRSRRRFEIK